MACKGKYEEWLKPENLKKITDWRAHGYSYERLAAEMGIGARTLYDWLELYPQFSQAIKKGEKLIPRTIEQSFLDRVINGAKSTETKKTFRKGDQGDSKEIGHTETTKVIPVEPTLLIFALCNLMGEKYKNSHTVEGNFQVEEKPRIDVKSLPKKDLVNYIKQRYAERQAKPAAD